MCRFRAVLFCVLLLLAGSRDVLAFRCSGGLISEGDSKLTVLDKCGKPTWIDRWPEEIVEFPDTDFEHRISRVNERWLYNLGPTRLIRILTLRDGRVVRIETGSRGFSGSPGVTGCDFDTLSLGISTVEVAVDCGEPDLAEQRYELVTEPIPGGRRRVSVSIDEWTFNLGPTRFLRILTFRNGVLTSVKTGEKGFSGP